MNLSTSLHPNIDAQVERTIKTIEDILGVCVIYFKGDWDDHLLLIEFAYNNIYHSNIQMTPYVDIYANRFKSPITLF